MPYYFQCHHIVLLPIWAFSSFFAFYLTNIGRNTAVDNRGEQCILITNTFSYDDSSNVVPPPPHLSLSAWLLYCFGLWNSLVFWTLLTCLIINCLCQCSNNFFLWPRFWPCGNTSLHENRILRPESGSEESHTIFVRMCLWFFLCFPGLVSCIFLLMLCLLPLTPYKQTLWKNRSGAAALLTKPDYLGWEGDMLTWE